MGYLEPFKEWQVSTIIHNIREKILAKINNEFKADALQYLTHLDAENLPFPNDFSGEPEQIIQIKNLFNGLYYTEKVFKNLEKIHVFSLASIMSAPSIVNEAYKASQLLLGLTVEFSDAFKSELSSVYAYLALLPPFNPDFFKQLAPSAENSWSWNVGNISGHILQQMKPSNGKIDYDLLSYFTAVLPQYIEETRLKIIKKTSLLTKHTPNVNKEKIEDLVRKGETLAHTLKHSNQDFIFFVRNIQFLMQQIQELSLGIVNEVGYLDDTLQSLTREYLAVLKYQILPHLLALVDKLEIQLLLKPGRLSKPLMRQIKPLYEQLIQLCSHHVDFAAKGENLLKLEDADFMACRFKDRNKECRDSKKAVFQSERLLLAIDNMLPNLTFVLNDTHRQLLIDDFNTDIKPYLLNLDPALAESVTAQFTTKPSASSWGGNPLNQNMITALRGLKNQMLQMKTDHLFKIKLNEDVIKAAHDHANPVLFPSNNPHNVFQVSDAEGLEHRTNVSESLVFSKGMLPNVTNPEQLSSDEAWDLYHWYAAKHHDVLTAREACQQFIKTLASNPNLFVGNQLQFKPNYTVQLLDEPIIHQANTLYAKIEGAYLKYEVLEPLPSGCKIVLSTVSEAEQQGQCDCYIWDATNNQLSYINAMGQLQPHVVLNNKAILSSFIRLNKIKFGQTKELMLSAKTIKNLITLNGGHVPGLIHVGTLPLTTLNCNLKEFKSPQQLQRYLPRIYEEALEKGHIQDPQRSNLIKWYSAFQPYLMSAYQENDRMAIRTFDGQAVQVLSGRFHQETSIVRPQLSMHDFVLKLANLQNILDKEEKKRLLKRDLFLSYAQNAKQHERVPAKNNSVLIAQKKHIKHDEFSFNVAEFMQSLDPIKRQIHASKKSLFKIKLALKHLANYELACKGDDRLFDGNPIHPSYPYFQSYAIALQAIEAGNGSPVGFKERLSTYLRQIEFYESNQIKRNQNIIDSVVQKNKISHFAHAAPAQRIDLSETQAFTELGERFTPVFWTDNFQPTANQLALKIVNTDLCFSFLHYGTPYSGTIPLTKFTPALAPFDENTTFNAEQIDEIVLWIHQERSQKITQQPRALIPDEALDLYQWYETKWHELSASKEAYIAWGKTLEQYAKGKHKERAKLKLAAEKLYPSIQPYLMYVKHQHPEKVDSFEKAFHYFIDETKRQKRFHKISAEIHKCFDDTESALKSKINRYKWVAKKPPQRNQPPAKKAVEAIVDRSKYMLNHTALSTSLSHLKTYLEKHYALFNDAFQEQLKKGGPGPLPFPEVEDAVHVYRQPQQIMAFKRITNLLHYLELIVHELEAMHGDENKLDYVTHLIKAYLHLTNSLPLLDALSIDPHLHAFYQDITAKMNALYGSILHLGKPYEVEDTKANPVSSPGLLYITNIFKILPDHLHLSTANLDRKLPLLKEKSAQMTKNIEKIIHHYQSSFAVLLLFFDSFLIKNLITELKLDVTALLSNTHDAAINNLEKINTTLLAKIILEAVAWENRLGLKPGLLSEPLTAIVAEFYKGLVTSLVADADQQAHLLTSNSILIQRRKITLDHKRSAVYEAHMQQGNVAQVQGLMEATTALRGSYFGKAQQEDQVQRLYQSTLPLLKTALKGSELYLMTLEEATQAALTDCFIWNEQQLTLYHLDAQGRPNPQQGGHLELCSLAVGQALPKFPADVKHKPTLIKQGHHYFLYGNTDGSQWKLTAVDAAIIEKLDIDFSRTKLPFHSKHQELYAHLQLNKACTHPIALKHPYALLQCVAQKSKDPRTKKPRTPKVTHFYLAEHDIQRLITSNSDFTYKKHGVNAPYEPDFIDNPELYTPTTQNIQKLQTLLPRIKAFYEGLNATAVYDTATADEQLHFLDNIEQKRGDENAAQRLEIYNERGKHIIKKLCKKSSNFSYYKLDSDYDDALQTFLIEEHGQFLSATPPFALTADRVNKHLVAMKNRFQLDHDEHYQQLSEVYQALDGLQLYLNHARVYWSTRSSLFESANTLAIKQGIVNELYRLANDKNKAIDARIAALQTTLNNNDVLDDLFAYEIHQPYCFAQLVQKIFSLLEVLGLYTPRVVQQVEDIVNAVLINATVTAKPAAHPRLSFFAAHKRAQLKARIEEAELENINDEESVDGLRV